MNTSVSTEARSRHAAATSVRLLLGTLIVVAIAAIGTRFIFSRAQRPDVSQSTPTQKLSQGTLAVLQNLQNPVELRFYYALDTNTLPESLQAFGLRVARLLETYEREADGKIRVVRIDPNNAGTTARADGIRPFNLDRGDPSYLGIALEQGDRRESLPRLQPEWESALEADLTRALMRLETTAPSTIAEAQSLPEEDAINSVRRAVPNLAEISLAEARTRILENGQAEFRRLGSQWQIRLNEAEQQVANAESRSAADHQTALQRLQELQAERAKALAQIVDQIDSQIRTVEQLKSGSP